MASYYFIDRQRQRRGPVEESQLLAAGVTADTFVWKVGMEQWEKAGTVPSLRYIFVNERAEPPRPSTIIREISARQNPWPEAQQQSQQQNFQQQPQQPSVCPPTYLAWAIVSTILCCLPFGIVAIVHSSKVSGLWEQRRYDEAQRASNTAKNWIIASAVSALVYYACTVGLFIITN